MHIDRIPVYRVYQRAIDLELYHAFAELVVQTSQDDTARRTYRQTRAMQIWQVETDVSGYFEPYHLRYPGEVLERFEEKLGNDVRVLRALALALGNTCAIQSDNMFVGNQRGAFLQKLRRSAGEDVYLQGALYLLETDAAQRHALLEKLAERECTRTEESISKRSKGLATGLIRRCSQHGNHRFLVHWDCCFGCADLHLSRSARKKANRRNDRCTG